MSKDDKNSMNYMRPEMVRSPKERLSGLKVLCDKGEGENWSLAEVIWDNEECLAVRWNGSFNDKKLRIGLPQARGLPMWFILPTDPEFVTLFNNWVKKTSKKG